MPNGLGLVEYNSEVPFVVTRMGVRFIHAVSALVLGMQPVLVSASQPPPGKGQSEEGMPELVAALDAATVRWKREVTFRAAFRIEEGLVTDPSDLVHGPFLSKQEALELLKRSVPEDRCQKLARRFQQIDYPRVLKGLVVKTPDAFRYRLQEVGRPIGDQVVWESACVGVIVVSYYEWHDPKAANLHFFNGSALPVERRFQTLRPELPMPLFSCGGETHGLISSMLHRPQPQGRVTRWRIKTPQSGEIEVILRTERRRSQERLVYQHHFFFTTDPYPFCVRQVMGSWDEPAGGEDRAWEMNAPTPSYVLCDQVRSINGFPVPARCVLALGFAPQPGQDAIPYWHVRRWIAEDLGPGVPKPGDLQFRVALPANYAGYGWPGGDVVNLQDLAPDRLDRLAHGTITEAGARAAPDGERKSNSPRAPRPGGAADLRRYRLYADVALGLSLFLGCIAVFGLLGSLRRSSSAEQ